MPKAEQKKYNRKNKYYHKKQNSIKEEPIESIRLIPLGGLNEIGKNMTVYECKGDMFIVDCGNTFPDSEMFGVDLVIPDFSYVRHYHHSWTRRPYRCPSIPSKRSKSSCLRHTTDKGSYRKQAQRTSA